MFGTMDGAVIFVAVMVIAAISAYFIPTAVALARNHKTAQVFVINLFFGWSLLGWVIALVWALGSKVTVVKQQTD